MEVNLMKFIFGWELQQIYRSAKKIRACPSWGGGSIYEQKIHYKLREMSRSTQKTHVWSIYEKQTFARNCMQFLDL